MSKESFKTLLLSVLFVLSIVLIQQLWITIPIASIAPAAKEVAAKQTTEDEPIINISEVLSPQSFTINFGGVNHTVIFSDTYGLWEETLQVLKAYFEEGVIIEEISPERWEELNDVRGIRIDLGFNLPMTTVKKVVEGKDFGLSQKIGSIHSFIIPVFEDATAYLWNKGDNKYYKVMGKVSKDQLGNLIDQIEEEGYDSYYAIKDMMGVENNNLLPIAIENNIPILKVGKEIDINDLSQVDVLASAFFGENFDFVKRIVETNGSVVYMYGYGKKVLKINGAGVLEYTEVLDGQQPMENIDVWESMKVAFEFIQDHGRLPADRIHLEGIIDGGKEKKEGYVFLFGYSFDGVPVHVDENIMQVPIEIKVVGNKVTYYKRWIKKEKIDVSFVDEEDKDILPPKEVLDRNFEYIRRTYLDGQKQEIKLGEEDKILKEILTSIRTVEIGYYDQPIGEMNSLIPVWIIQIGKDLYYFDAHTGRIVNRFKI